MNDSSPELLRCRKVAKTYVAEDESIQAVHDVDLALMPGETLALVGPSGCGKSTLLLLMAGLEKPSSGSVEFMGNAVSRPRKEIGLVLQDYGLFPWKTVRQNVELGLKIRGETAEAGRVDALLAELGIGDKSEAYPQQLSGGQKQRVALARALILNPSLLLLDEPFAAVDTLTRERLQDLVANTWLTRRFGMAVVTHNIQEAVRLGRRILVMGDQPGRILDMVDNPLACAEDFRGSDEFYRICRRVREGLEEMG